MGAAKKPEGDTVYEENRGRGYETVAGNIRKPRHNQDVWGDTRKRLVGGTQGK